MIESSAIEKRIIDFDSRFGRGGHVDLYFAPGRVNLIGEHTDYNGGFVLPVAIERGTYMLIRKTELPPVRIYSENRDKEARFDPSNITRENDWADYVRGVYLYATKYFGELPPFDGYYFGDLPLGAGLSSSASIELVTAVALKSVGCEMPLERAVIISRRAENDFVGVSCGIMDQFTVAFARKGYALLINCDTLEHSYVPFNIPDCSLVVGHTGIYRSLSDTPYNTRLSECHSALSELEKKLGPKKNLSKVSVLEFERVKYSLPETLAMRAEHVILENIRVEEAVLCLERGDPEKLGYLMNRSHESLRDLYEVSSPELDALQRISLEHPGVWGCRLTGAGFGGCVIALVKTDALESYLRSVPDKYWKATRLEGEFIVTKPEGGARKLEAAT